MVSDELTSTSYGVLFEATRSPYLILAADAPRFTITGVNAAYLRATMTKRESLIGRGVFDAFSDNPHQLKASGISDLRESLERALVGRGTDAMAMLQYDILRADGSFEERYWNPTNTAMLNAAGEPIAILHHAEDVTEYVLLRTRSTELDQKSQLLEEEVIASVRRLEEVNERLRASEERYRALTSASSDVIYQMSADWTEMRHLEGRKFIADTHEPSGSWLLKYIAPDDQPRVMDAIQAAIRSKGVLELEHRVVRVDGTPGWTFSRAIPFLDSNGEIREWFGAASDITARKEVEEALRQSEEKFRTLFESIDEGYCVVEMIFDADARPVDYRFLQINPAFEKHTGIANAQGKRMREIAPDHDAHWFEAYGRVAVTGEPTRFVNEAKSLDGRWFDVYAFRLGGHGSHTVAILFSDITDRQHAAEALQRSESRLRAVLEQAPLAVVFTGPSGEILFRNAMFDVLWGRPPHTATARTYSEVYSGYHLDGRPVASEEWPAARAVLKGEVTQGAVYKIVQANGDRITCWFAGGPIRDEAGKIVGAVVMFRDVTDERRTLEALRTSEERRRLALDAAELGMWHVEPGTRVTKTDARYRAIFGTTEDWTDYLQALAVIHPDDQSAVLEAVAAATRLENPAPYAIEYRIVHPDGSLRWIFAKGLASIAGTGPTRRVASFDGTVADITDRKRSEEEREQLVARLREQDQRKDEFLATLAHELRNPLAPIRNGLQIMRLAKSDPEATEKVRAMMERQLGQMVHLIDDLLDLSRISRGKIDLRKERIELANAIEQSIEASRPFIAQGGHELLIEMLPGPIHVDADLTRLAQVFSNLLNNAAKYTDRGGQILLTVQHLGTEVVVSVRDNGIGIPTHMLAHVFEMFTQVDRNLDRSQGGLGVGLSIAQRLVQMHGGSVEARSDGLGSGSEFVVRLPVASSSVGDERSNQPNPDYPSARRRILVVDDNLDAAESLAMMLTMTGNETLTAHDGLEALEVAAAFRPDIMLLDIGMPKMNGYEVCRRLRQEPWGKDTVVIALTGWGLEEDKRKSKEAGVNSHLVKPASPAAIEKLLAGMTATTLRPADRFDPSAA